MMSDVNLQVLLDRAGIDDAINAYSQALDQREWSLLEDAFTSNARIVLIDRDVVYTPQSLVTALSVNDATRLGGQHLVGKTTYSISGDTSHATTEVIWTTLQSTEQAEEFLLVRGTGLYRDTLVKEEAGWRIADRELALKSITRDHVELSEIDLTNIRYTLAGDWV